MSEADFSRALVSMWRAHGHFVQRVETGTISRGVPDLYVATKQGQTWIELKSVKWKPYDGMQIPWRAGQQGWMLEHYKTTGVRCYTMVHCPNCYLIIPMVKRFPRNVVMLADVQVCHTLKELDL